MHHKNLAYGMVAPERSEGRINQKAAIRSEPLLDHLRLVNRVFVLDTCYLIRLAQSGHGVYNSLLRLSQKGEIMVTKQVVEEFQRNAQSKRDVKKDDVAELYRAINSNVVFMEKVEVSQDEHKALAGRMESLSAKNNRRLGAGDASIITLVDVLRGIYERITVLSEDSDLHMSIPPTAGVMVKNAV